MGKQHIRFRKHSSHTALNMQNKTRSVSTYRTLLCFFFSFYTIRNCIINLLAQHDSFSFFTARTYNLVRLLSSKEKHILICFDLCSFYSPSHISIKYLFSTHLTWESLSQRSPNKISPLYCAEQMNFHSKNFIILQKKKTKKKRQPLVCIGWLFFSF